MAGPYLPAKLGPFVGGINTLSDASAIADNELADCINMELDLDGSYITRPPITAVAGPPSWLGTNILALGFFTFATGSYLLGSNTTGTYYKQDGGAWILIAANLQSVSAVEYGGYVYILATNGSTVGSGRWNPSTAFSLVANMPRGNKILIYKDRAFVCAGESATVNSSRIWLSAPTDPSNWTTAVITSTIDINPGDGQDLVDIIIYNNAVVCFKQSSTYFYSFNLLPSDGSVRVLSTTIGVPTHHCAVSFENNVYIYSNGRIYEIIKLNFACINLKVPFFYDGTAPGAFISPIFVTVHGSRLLIRYYHRIYAFGIRTRTWTRWESTSYFGPFVSAPVNLGFGINQRYFAGSCVANDPSIYQCNDGYDNVQNENMICTVLTKNYDYSHQIRVGRYFLTQTEKMKKIYWWGVDVQTANDVKGTATPITYNQKSTWAQLSGYTWQQLNTWALPLSLPNLVSLDVFDGDGSFARFVKFPKTIRFRQIHFRIDITSHGTLADGPDRVFTMITPVSSRSYVSAGVG